MLFKVIILMGVVSFSFALNTETKNLRFGLPPIPSLPPLPRRGFRSYGVADYRNGFNNYDYDTYYYDYERNYDEENMDEKPEFNYDPRRPNRWNELFPGCRGKSQSPIDIDTSDAIFNSNLDPIIFKNYNINYLFNFTNSWSSKSIVSNQFKDNITGLVPYITGSNFEERFNLLQFHFHWGPNPQSGSEHLLDGESFAGELHLVHQSPSGKLAVVGFFLSVTDRDNPDLNNLIKTVMSNADSDSVSTVYMRLTNILPDLDEANESGYFRYSGSLTIPPCTEGIIWNVFKEPIEISARQMQAFYRNSVRFNFRPVQPLNGRRVFVSA